MIFLEPMWIAILWTLEIILYVTGGKKLYDYIRRKLNDTSKVCATE